MKNQALFSSKDKSEKLKCHRLQFLFCALRVNDVTRFSEFCELCICNCVNFYQVSGITRF